MRQSLNNLLRLNRGKGQFRADAGENGNTILLYDVIVSSDDDAAWLGGCSAENVMRALMGMTGRVQMHINSPGGDVFAGIAIAQAIRSYPDGVDVYVDGIAASIASIIAISGSTVTVAPGSFMMIHKAWTIMLGNADDLMREAALLEKIDENLADQYRARAGEATDWIAAMAAETWFTADEAVAAGLADSVAMPKPMPKSGENARWDLSAFAKAPAPEVEPEPEPIDPSIEIAARERRLAVDLLSTPA